MADKSIEADEIKIICDVYSKFMGYYITWFTWFFYLNLAAMAALYVYSTGNFGKHIRPVFLVISAFFSVINIFGCVATWQMAAYKNRCSARIAQICANSKECTTHKIDQDIAVGDIVVRPVLFVMLLTLLLTIAAWISLGLRIQGIISWPPDLFPN